jgi:hypothetical protein
MNKVVLLADSSQYDRDDGLFGLMRLRMGIEVMGATLKL